MFVVFLENYFTILPHLPFLFLVLKLRSFPTYKLIVSILGDGHIPVHANSPKCISQVAVLKNISKNIHEKKKNKRKKRPAQTIRFFQPSIIRMKIAFFYEKISKVSLTLTRIFLETISLYINITFSFIISLKIKFIYNMYWSFVYRE